MESSESNRKRQRSTTLESVQSGSATAGPSEGARKKAKVDEQNINEPNNAGDVDGSLKETASDDPEEQPEDATGDADTANVGEQASAGAQDQLVVVEDSTRPCHGGESSRKRPRLESEPIAPEEPPRQPRASFLTLPLELLTEVLVLTASPKTVLAVARTCRALCHTLIARDMQWVWRDAREANVVEHPVKNLVAKIPDVKELLGEGNHLAGEVGYTAFVYGGGVCEMCKKLTDRAYVSYALRIRLCEDRACATAFVGSNKLISESALLERYKLTRRGSIIPVLEDANILPNVQSGMTRRELPQGLKAFLLEERQNPQFREILDAKYIQGERWMQLCRALVKWRRQTNEIFHANKKANEKLGQTFAEEFGLNYKDMVNCTDYGVYHRHKNICYESVRKSDANVLKPTIEEQLSRLSEKRDRRDQEAMYQQNKEQVAQHYKYLLSLRGTTFKPDASKKKSKSAIDEAENLRFAVLPALSAFRTLPVIAMLQQNTTSNEERVAEQYTKSASSAVTSTVAKSLKTDPVLSKMLKSQINDWVAKARMDLGKVAGIKGRWTSVSRVEVHPVERADVRFRCTRCDSRAEERAKKEGKDKAQLDQDIYGEDGCFDFKAACAHDCGKPGQNKAKGGTGNRFKWEAKNFVKDEQAGAALRQYFKLCDVDEKSGLGASAALDGPNYVVCTSCEVELVMKPRNMIGHSHRHAVAEPMQLRVLSSSPPEDLIGKFPFRAGLTKKLVRPSPDKVQAALAERQKKVWGCRVCYMRAWGSRDTSAAAAPTAASTGSDIAATSIPSNETQAISGSGEATEAATKDPEPTLMSFDGLRSHVKIKHNILEVRDEDYFCVEVPTMGYLVSA